MKTKTNLKAGGKANAGKKRLYLNNDYEALV